MERARDVARDAVEWRRGTEGPRARGVPVPKGRGFAR